MNERIRQWIAAFLIGGMLPNVVYRFGTELSGDLAEDLSSQTEQSTQSGQLSYLSAASDMIPVLFDDVLRIMDLDTYLVGVLMAEMPADFEIEALKAQAVAARTCALQRIEKRDKHFGGAVCTDSACCQAYMSVEQYYQAGGTEEMVKRMQVAVAMTTAQVLTYEGKLIEAAYFSCSGGRTEDAIAVWGAEVPYLRSVVSPGEEHAEIYSNTVEFSHKEFMSLLGRNLTGDPAKWLGEVVRTRGGGVASMVIGGKTYTGTELRSLLSLNSTAFTMTAHGDKITVVTSGRGHRVGMSQYGADAMAAAGSSYDEILAYYYPGTRIDKLSAVG